MKKCAMNRHITLSKSVKYALFLNLNFSQNRQTISNMHLDTQVFLITHQVHNWAPILVNPTASFYYLITLHLPKVSHYFIWRYNNSQSLYSTQSSPIVVLNSSNIVDLLRKPTIFLDIFPDPTFRRYCLAMWIRSTFELPSKQYLL